MFDSRHRPQRKATGRCGLRYLPGGSPGASNGQPVQIVVVQKSSDSAASNSCISSFMDRNASCVPSGSGGSNRQSFTFAPNVSAALAARIAQEFRATRLFASVTEITVPHAPHLVSQGVVHRQRLPRTKAKWFAVPARHIPRDPWHEYRSGLGHIRCSGAPGRSASAPHGVRRYFSDRSIFSPQIAKLPSD